MSYKDEYHPKVKSDLKKLDKGVVREIYDIHLDNILHEPYSGEKLHGDLEGVSSYHFRKNKVDYRNIKKKIVVTSKACNGKLER